MSDDFDELKSMWNAVDPQLNLEYSALQREIEAVRKRRKKNIHRWCISLLLYSLSVLAYVIYTDKLNSNYERVSEWIFLFTSLFLFYTSLKKIRKQRKEYLLSNADFLATVPLKEEKERIREGRGYCVSFSLILLAIFLHFFEAMRHSPTLLTTSIGIVVVLNWVSWKVFRPFYVHQKRRILSK